MKISYRMFALLLCIVVTTWSSGLSAATYDSAINAYERRDYNTAIREFKELSRNNDPYAQYMLGKMYATGEGVRRDYVTAFKWLHLSEMNGVDAATQIKRDIGRKMSNQQKSKAKRLAEELRNPIDSTDRQAEILDPVVVRKVQQELANRGQFFDKVDGLVGGRTRNAIRRFQQSQGMVEDGKVTKDLLDGLGLSELVTSPAPEWEDQKNDTELAVLKKKLRRIIRKAKKSQAAEPWLIRKLEKLVDSKSDQWANLVLHEDFQANKYQGGAGWQVVSGNFQLEPQKGLIITPEGNWGSFNKNIDDLALSLLDSLMKHSHRQLSSRNLAKMENDISFTNAFALKFKTGSLEATEGLVISCGLEGETAAEYRLVLQPGKGKKAMVFKVINNNATEIKTFHNKVVINKSVSHTFEWTRSSRGVMTVSIDGQKLFQVNDIASITPFNRLSIAHIGSKLILKDIKLYDSGEILSNI